MVKSSLFLLIFIIFSCSTGHKDKYGIYVPNHPNYKLKDIKGDEIPKELDTVNLYKYYGYFYKITNSLIKEDASKEWGIYDKYCSNGRVYSFGTDNLNEKSLDPNYGSKGYYIYSQKKHIIIQESYVDTEGVQYVKIKYKISKNGDTLTTSEGGASENVYIKVIILKDWKRYNPDW